MMAPTWLRRAADASRRAGAAVARPVLAALRAIETRELVLIIGLACSATGGAMLSVPMTLVVVGAVIVALAVFGVRDLG